MTIKDITTTDEHAQALTRLSVLMDLDPEIGSDENIELELLAVAIEDYEAKFILAEVV